MIYVVQYQHEEWPEVDWRFIGVFTDESTARQWVEKQFLYVEWRKSLGGELTGDHAQGIGIHKYSPTRFVVMPVEPNDLIGRTFYSV